MMMRLDEIGLNCETVGKKKHCCQWCAACGGQHEWRAPNRMLMVQIGADAERAKVSRAHAAPLGFCDNLINALKLQRGGDRPIESIVIGLHEGSRRGIIDGFRNNMKADNHREVDVGHLRQGIIPLHVQKKQQHFSEGSPQRRPSGKEQMSELMKWEHWGPSSILTTLSTTDGSPPLVDADWHASCNFQRNWRRRM